MIEAFNLDGKVTFTTGKLADMPGTTLLLSILLFHINFNQNTNRSSGRILFEPCREMS